MNFRNKKLGYVANAIENNINNSIEIYPQSYRVPDGSVPLGAFLPKLLFFWIYCNALSFKGNKKMVKFLKILKSQGAGGYGHPVQLFIMNIIIMIIIICSLQNLKISLWMKKYRWRLKIAIQRTLYTGIKDIPLWGTR